MTPLSAPSARCPCATLLRQEPRVPLQQQLNTICRAGKKLRKSLRRIKTQLEISLPIFMTQSQRLSSGFGKTKSCSLPHESAGDLSWVLSQGVTPGILHDSQFPHVFAHVCRLLRVAKFPLPPSSREGWTLALFPAPRSNCSAFEDISLESLSPSFLASLKFPLDVSASLGDSVPSLSE